MEKRKSFAAAKNAEAARAQLLKQITRADALAAGKASADAAAAHSKRVAERAKDAAHTRVSRAAAEFARYRAAVEARLRDTAPPLFHPLCISCETCDHCRLRVTLHPSRSA